MREINFNEKTNPWTAQKGYENIHQPGGKGIAGVEIQVARRFYQRIYRAGGSQSCGYPRGEAEVGGNIDQLIQSIRNQIAINQQAIESIFAMQSELKACLDELIEIREKSKNID